MIINSYISRTFPSHNIGTKDLLTLYNDREVRRSGFMKGFFI